MSEKEIRETLAKIDDLRERARTLEKVAQWPSGVPSEVKVDTVRGIFRSIWHGGGSTVMGEITLTLAERHELRTWMIERAQQSRLEAERLAGTLGVQ